MNKMSKLLLALTIILLLIHQTHQEEDEDDKLPDFMPKELDFDQDGFSINQDLPDLVFDEHRSIEEEEEANHKESRPNNNNNNNKEKEIAKHVFEKVCPYGYFTCNNGECLSSKWRCDGHYDCDDFSDELNCLAGSPIPSTGIHINFDTPTTKSPQTAQHHEEFVEIKFNSSIEPLMLFSTGVSIRGYWMKSRIYFDVISMANKPKGNGTPPPSISQALSVFFDLLNIERQAKSTAADETPPKARSTIVGIDMDPHDKEVFWVELGKDAGVYSTVIDDEQFQTRLRRQFGGPKRRTLVDSGLLSPEDVALDPVAKNVYITDAGLPAIVVCTIKHSHCRILVRDNIHKPRAIIADPATGWLTYTDWGDHPGIFLVSMDGRRRETLIDTDIVWPNGLAVDHAANHLYWADARLSKIERVDLITKKRREIVKETAGNPFSLSLFEDRLYWSDWSGNDIRTCNKVSGNNTKALMRTENIYGIHIYHPTLQAERENPCWDKHCSHLCLLAPTRASFADRKAGSTQGVCSCPESMALSIGDQATCYEVQLTFLLVNVKNYIAQVFPEQIGLRTVEKVLYSKEHIIHDVASDWIHYRLFFFDAAKRFIYTAELADKPVKITQFLPTSPSVRGLLYDGWSDNLYWLDSDHGTLSMGSLKAKFETVVRRDLERPVAMVLDSKSRLFYIAMLGSTPHIMRTNIFAQESSDLVLVGTDIGLPIALHLDEHQQRLYWADAKRESIESLDLDISQASGVKANSRQTHRRQLGTILAFAVYHDHFIWTIKNGDYLYRSPIKSSLDGPRPVGLRLPPNPSIKDPTSDNTRIIVVDPKREQVVRSPCQTRGCSHACVLDANHNAICVCPNDMVLKLVNCVPRPQVTTELTVVLPKVKPAEQVEVKTQQPELKTDAPELKPEVRTQEAKHEHEPEVTPSGLNAKPGSLEIEPRAAGGSSMVWLLVTLFLLLSLGAIAVLVSWRFKQVGIPSRMRFISADKDGSVLLLDE